MPRASDSAGDHRGAGALSFAGRPEGKVLKVSGSLRRSMSSPAEKAEAFRRMHLGAHPLVLPNAWDVASARMFEECGFPAVATSSAGLCASLGYPDGESIPKREFFAAVRRIAAHLEVPLTVDLVAGFGRGAREVAASVRRALDAGAVGINIEDQRPSDHTLFSIGQQERKIRAIRDAGALAGVPLVVNARTDALVRAPGTPEEQFREAVRRATAYRDAGADCVYPMRLVAGEAIRRFVAEVACPVNVMVRPGLPPLSELEALGVKRVSFGPAASYAAMGLLRRISEEVRGPGTFGLLTEGAISHEELGRLSEARRPR